MNAGGRLNTCKSDGNMAVAIRLMTSGARVRNAYATCPRPGQNAEKLALISHADAGRHRPASKDSLVGDGHACH